MEGLKKGILVRNGTAVGALGDKYFSTAPIGTVLSFAGQIAPHGYLLCNGASYKVADYPDLYAVIGNTYGGDTENFNVPNLVDKFIEGSTTSGTEKEAGLPNITGSFVPWGYQKNLNPSGAFSQSGTNLSAYDAYGANKGSQINFNASQSNTIYGNSDTVQPPALTMVYIIKAFYTNEGVDSGVSDDVINYINNSTSYSTEEHLTGGKWIDGKPVYEKTVFSSFTNYTVGEYKTFSIPFGNINVISIDGMINYDSAYPVPVNYYYENPDKNNIQRMSTFYSKNRGTIVSFVYASMETDYVNANYFVTVRYTKPTD